jgi:NAD(P)H-nitrite reductase large subunit
VSEPLVIVGNGMAAARLVDELTSCAHGRHAIALIGGEPRLAYNRALLSSVLAGCQSAFKFTAVSASKPMAESPEPFVFGRYSSKTSFLPAT